MAASREDIEAHVHFPRESLAVELKSWIDPEDPEGAAKIIRTAIALRNNNGGFLLVGFDNATGKPLTSQAPGNPRERFHQDRIQSLVAKYASELFEVHVHFAERDGIEFPVLEIEAGVKTPVAAKAALNSRSGKTLVRQHGVYVRSLSANNTASTTEATWRDWPRVVEISIDNREADIGRFVRRHLAGLSAEVLREIATLGAPQPPPPNAESQARALLDEGEARYQARAREVEQSIPDHGSWEVALVINGVVPKHAATREFLNLLASTNPNYTGWPVWLDTRDFAEKAARPNVVDGAWEAFVLARGLGIGDHLDFWRLDPHGRFYLRRALQDDFIGRPDSPEPFTVLDFALVVLKAAEALAVGIEFAKAIGCPREETQLAFAFRWSRLRGRELVSWADRGRYVSPGRRAQQDQVASSVVMPLDTPPASIQGFVKAATDPLFRVFQGFELPATVIEDLTRRLLERRL